MGAGDGVRVLGDWSRDLRAGTGRDRAHWAVGGSWARRVLLPGFSGGMGRRVTAAVYSRIGRPSYFCVFHAGYLIFTATL